MALRVVGGEPPGTETEMMGSFRVSPAYTVAAVPSALTAVRS